jgi:hypothetical protein
MDPISPCLVRQTLCGAVRRRAFPFLHCYSQPHERALEAIGGVEGEGLGRGPL